MLLEVVDNENVAHLSGRQAKSIENQRSELRQRQPAADAAGLLLLQQVHHRLYQDIYPDAGRLAVDLPQSNSSQAFSTPLPSQAKRNNEQKESLAEKVLELSHRLHDLQEMTEFTAENLDAVFNLKQSIVNAKPFRLGSKEAVDTFVDVVGGSQLSKALDQQQVQWRKTLQR